MGSAWKSLSLCLGSGGPNEHGAIAPYEGTRRVSGTTHVQHQEDYTDTPAGTRGLRAWKTINLTTRNTATAC